MNLVRTPSQARSKARVDRILAAAATLLAETDKPLTLRLVAARAGVPSSSIYQYFSDMDGLAEAIAARARTTVAERLVASLPPLLMKDPERYYSTLIDSLEALQEIHPELVCMVRSHHNSAFARTLGTEMRQVVEKHIEKALRGISSRSPIPVRQRVALVSAILTAVLGQAPARTAPERRAYLILAARLAASATNA